MTTQELLKKVRQIEIKTKGLSNHIFSGEYHSAFKGRGMSFSEVRDYSPGDDVRKIDWNVTARFSAPFVKVFEEERELTVMLLVDISSSSLFGSINRTKRTLITEIAAVLSFSAINNNDKVGVIFFSDKVEKYIPPNKGKSHILRIIREMLALEPKDVATTDVGACLKFFNNAQKKKTISFLLSDLISEPYEEPLKLAARKHDFIGIQVFDPVDRVLPNVGLLSIEDAEAGAQAIIDTNDKRVTQQYTAAFDQQQQYNKNAFIKSGAQLLSISTDQDYVSTLKGFFKGR